MDSEMIIKGVLILTAILFCIGLLIYLRVRYRRTEAVRTDDSPARIGISVGLYKVFLKDPASGERFEMLSATQGRSGETCYVYRRADGRGYAFRTRVKVIIYITILLLLLILCLLIRSVGFKGLSH